MGSVYSHFLDKVGEEALSTTYFLRFKHLLVLAFNLPLIAGELSGFQPLEDRRIQQEKPNHSLASMAKAVLRYLLLDFFITAPITRRSYKMWKKAGILFDSNSIPDVFTIAAQLLLFALLHDVVFYAVHRALHIPILYKYVHKQHHEYVNPVGISAEYSHPIETLTNILPFSLPPLLLARGFRGNWKPHLFTIYIWLVLQVFETVLAHSDYDIPCNPLKLFGITPRFHSFHHARYNQGNFGSFFTLMDRYFGTDAPFREEEQKRLQQQQS